MNDAVGLFLIASLNCWRNSTPFLCKASFCTMKIDHFRAQAIDHVVFLQIRLLKNQLYLMFGKGIIIDTISKTSLSFI